MLEHLRMPIVRLVVVLVTTTTLLVGIQFWLLLAGGTGTTDVLPVYAAGTLINQEHAGLIYDHSAIIDVEKQLAPSTAANELSYLFPPATAALSTPLARLPFALASRLWSVVQMALIAAGILLAIPTLRRDARIAIGVAAFAFLSAPVAMDVIQDQWAGFDVLAIGMMLMFWRRGESRGVGVALGLALCVGKPHLLLGLIGFCIGRRDWRILLWSATTSAVVALATLPIVGIHVYGNFLATVTTLGVSQSPTSYVGIAGTVSTALGDGRLTGVVSGILIAGLFMWCVWIGSRSAQRPATSMIAAVCAAGLLITPHVRPYDLAILAPCVAALVFERRLRYITLWVALAASACIDVLSNAGSIDLAWRVTPLFLVVFALVATSSFDDHASPPVPFSEARPGPATSQAQAGTTAHIQPATRRAPGRWKTQSAD
jgi:hypothetical protein